MTRKKVNFKTKQQFNKNIPAFVDSFSGCQYCNNNKVDEANLLLCDNEDHCSSEMHTYCLWPPLVKVPNTQWFCPQCDVVGMLLN